MIRKNIEDVENFKNLDKYKAFEISTDILNGRVCKDDIKDFLIALKIKGETYEEIAGFAKTLKQNCIKYRTNDKKFYDIVGTGGDKLNTFNISTTCAFVLSSMGLNIAKHGNRSVSSQCGSIDVLDELEIDTTVEKEIIENQLNEIGLSFIFAQKAHPLMKNVSSARKELGIPTIFNIVGPISNPVELTGQVIGVYKKELLSILNDSLIELGLKNFAILHGFGGMDEASLEGDNIVIFNRSGKSEEVILNCIDYGMKKRLNKDLIGGDKVLNAKILKSVLSGEEGAYADVVIFNCAIALYAFEFTNSIEEGIKLTEKKLKSKESILKLDELINISSVNIPMKNERS